MQVTGSDFYRFFLELLKTQAKRRCYTLAYWLDSPQLICILYRNYEHQCITIIYLPTSRPVIYIPLVLWIWFKENRFFIEMNPSCENCHVKSMVYCLTSFIKQRPLSVSPWGCHVLKAEFKWAGRWFFLGIPAGFESCGRLRWGGRNPCRGLVERMPEMTAGWQTWIHKITVNHCGWRDRQALREKELKACLICLIFIHYVY